MMAHDKKRREPASALGQFVCGPLATIAGAILFLLVIVQGESWAIRQWPPLLPTSCIADYSTDAGALPVSILH